MPSDTQEKTRPRKEASSKLSRAVLIGLVLGVIAGIVFGDYCAPLKLVGDVFIGLLQMTVLPYIILSLVVNIGGLKIEGARKLALWGTGSMLLLWGTTILVVLVIPLGLPAWEAGAFFSSSLVEEPGTIDFVELYIPVNPFASMAQNIVPATVVFSILVGGALIGAGGTRTLIDPLKVTLNALSRIATWVTHLTPIGVFALSASAAGTLSISQFGRLQGYVVIYVLAAIILTVVVLPALIAAITPFRMKDVLSVSKDAVLTALATDSVFIVLPLLIDGVKRLFGRFELENPDTAREIEISIPLAFPFPNAGKLLALVFIPFAAWYSGGVVPAEMYPNFIIAGISSLFAKVTVAIPFLLDLVRLPADLFNLFLLAGVIAGRFSSLAGAMHLFSFTTITVCGVTGLIRVRRRALLFGAVLTTAVLAVGIAGSRAYLSGSIEQISRQENILDRIEPVLPRVDFVVLEELSPMPDRLREGESMLDRIERRGVMRVGFNPEKIPFAYVNSRGELAGFDVEMAHQLAGDLGVTLEFVPVPVEAADEILEGDLLDLVMTGVVANAERYRDWPVSLPYLEVSPAILVPDHIRDRFENASQVRTQPFRLAVINEPSYLNLARDYLPNTEIVPVNRFQDFFAEEKSVADALLMPAEEGSAWTLKYPQYHVATPWKGNPKWPLVYLFGSPDQSMRNFLDGWVYLKRHDGTIDLLYEHWVLGKTAEPRKPRWSVVRNLLGWGVETDQAVPGAGE